MSNVLSEEKKQQVIALGKLGWSLRRIERATGVRRETAGAYLKAAGMVVRAPGAWGRRAAAKPANGVTPDLAAPFAESSGPPGDISPPSASACEPYRELIEQGLARGRNAKAIWQDLVSDHGFAGSYRLHEATEAQDVRNQALCYKWQRQFTYAHLTTRLSKQSEQELRSLGPGLSRQSHRMRVATSLPISR